LRSPTYIAAGGRDKYILSPVLDALDIGWYPLPDVTVQEMCLFLVIIVQMGLDQRDTLKDYWLTLEQYFTAFYGKTMK
jgi:hypothetical protein